MTDLFRHCIKCFDVGNFDRHCLFGFVAHHKQHKTVFGHLKHWAFFPLFVDKFNQLKIEPVKFIISSFQNFTMSSYHHFTAFIKMDNAIKKPISHIPQKRKLDNCAVIFLNSLIIDRISFKLSINLRSL
uniref:Uncharacterized protein n=1 Tax=Histophilus somni (strain 129Pt) TaxID=205914 RepID=Q0I4K0_HISS1